MSSGEDQEYDHDHEQEEQERRGMAGVPIPQSPLSELRRPTILSALLDFVPERTDALRQFPQPQLKPRLDRPQWRPRRRRDFALA